MDLTTILIIVLILILLGGGGWTPLRTGLFAESGDDDGLGQSVESDGPQADPTPVVDGSSRAVIYASRAVSQTARVML